MVGGMCTYVYHVLQIARRSCAVACGSELLASIHKWCWGYHSHGLPDCLHNRRGDALANATIHVLMGASERTHVQGYLLASAYALFVVRAARLLGTSDSLAANLGTAA